MGNDMTVSVAASQGNFELNVYMPVIIYNFIESVKLLAEAIESFTKNALSGLKVNHGQMQENLEKSLMLVTALNAVIGYENSAKIAKLAYQKGITLKEACLELGFLDGQTFDEVVNPLKMIGE